MIGKEINNIGKVSLHSGEEKYVCPASNDELFILDGDFETNFNFTGEKVNSKEVKFLLPIPPGKFIGIGRNFPGEETGKESQFPNFFVKTANALSPHLADVTLPYIFGSSIAEGELGVIIAKKAKNIKVQEVQQYILGYSAICDLSGRDFIDGDVNAPVAVKKSCDGFAPIGPFININPLIRSFSIQTLVDDREVQFGSSNDMIYSIEKCISYISSLMTLEPYDIISMGTPNPKPTIKKGQTVKVIISEMPPLQFTLK